MSTETTPRKKVAAIVALTAVAALLFFVFWPRDEAKPVAAPAAASSGPKIVVGGTPSPETEPTVLAKPAGSASHEGAPLTPVIDEITVEKTEVCEGEENLVTVRAHSPDGADGLLTYVIGTERGSQVPLRRYLDDKEDATITVHGARGSALVVAVPKYRVMNCRVPYIGDIGAWLLPNTEATFELGARAIPASVDAGAQPFVPVEYIWSFGDGTTEKTAQQRVKHSFEDRPMNSLDADFLVKVEMRAADGTKVVARKSITLRNALYEDFHDKGIVALQSYRDPVFPEISAEGVVRQGIRLRHIRPNAVKITSATRQVFYEDKTGNAQSDPAPVDVTALLGTTEIPSGRGLDVRVLWDTTSEPEVNIVTYALHGKTTDGYPVEGRFSIMKPPPSPAKGAGEAITDPALMAKIMAAQKILGKTTVSSTELADLEREGKLKDLPPAPK